jgi:hypothetical protein
VNRRQLLSVSAKWVGAGPSGAFLRDCLQGLREMRLEPLTARCDGVTDVKYTRLCVTGAGGNLVEIRR